MLQIELINRITIQNSQRAKRAKGEQKKYLENTKTKTITAAAEGLKLINQLIGN